MAESDEAISAQIKGALANEAAIAELEVDIETRDGIVYLRGEVDEEEQIAQATEIARQVPGVVEVRNQLVALRLRQPEVQPEVIWMKPRSGAEGAGR